MNYKLKVVPLRPLSHRSLAGEVWPVMPIGDRQTIFKHKAKWLI